MKSSKTSTTLFIVVLVLVVISILVVVITSLNKEQDIVLNDTLNDTINDTVVNDTVVNDTDVILENNYFNTTNVFETLTPEERCQWDLKNFIEEHPTCNKAIPNDCEYQRTQYDFLSLKASLCVENLNLNITK